MAVGVAMAMPVVMGRVPASAAGMQRHDVVVRMVVDGMVMSCVVMGCVVVRADVIIDMRMRGGGSGSMRMGLCSACMLMPVCR